MSKIALRLIFSVIPSVPIWILNGNLWLGLLVMFLVYIIIQVYQYIAAVKIMAIYDILSKYFVDEKGEKVDAETLRCYVENNESFLRKFFKIWRKYL